MPFPTAQEIAGAIKIGRPLERTFVTQPFGANDVGYYADSGLKGHNGIDYRANIGTPCYSCFNGTVIGEGLMPGDSAIYIRLMTAPFLVNDRYVKLEALYYHLSDEHVSNGEFVRQGQAIAKTGNTGRLTTGPHLHFGIRPLFQSDNMNFIYDYSNGYQGYVDPVPFMNIEFQKASETPAYNCYGKTRNWVLEYTFKFANTPVGTLLTPFLKQRIEAGRYIHRTLTAMRRTPPLLSTEELNAIIYGSWDLNYVLDPTLYWAWSEMTKAEFITKYPNLKV